MEDIKTQSCVLTKNADNSGKNIKAENSALYNKEEE
jgi:hypothetical protein